MLSMDKRKLLLPAIVLLSVIDVSSDLISTSHFSGDALSCDNYIIEETVRKVISDYANREGQKDFDQITNFFAMFGVSKEKLGIGNVTSGVSYKHNFRNFQSKEVGYSNGVRHCRVIVEGTIVDRRFDQSYMVSVDSEKVVDFRAL